MKSIATDPFYPREELIMNDSPTFFILPLSIFGSILLITWIILPFIFMSINKN
ncbi:MAG: hypothetical protein HW386_180 [Gammaproteobacteria bacterium]|nr:hypothetical protein [Gammaproteobacteria bacterium]